MSKVTKKWIGDDQVGALKILLENNSWLRGRNAADNANVNLLRLTSGDAFEFASVPVFGGNDLLHEGNKGVANGVAELDGSGKVPAAQLPSYVDDVEEYANLAAFPGTGEIGKIYVTLDDNKTYRWSGSAYVEISAGPADTDALAEGSTNFYYTEGRFDASLATKDTDDLTEGATNKYYATSLFEADLAASDTDDLTEGATNLYHTTARARTAAVVNSTAGNETDQAASVAAMKSYVEGEVSSSQANFAIEKFALSGTDITNQFVTLANEPVEGSLNVIPRGGLPQEIDVDFELDDTNADQINFLGDLASELAEGDILIVQYSY